MENQFMERALRIAFNGMGNTSPNPAVGAVIVKEGQVIGCGGTSPAGSDHAEVNAVRDADLQGHDLRNSEIYVTLEPCCHHGKTPPCTELLIRRGIKRVYIPLEDPNPVVSGQGVAQLRQAGIDVEILHDYREAAFDLIRAFRKRIISGIPYVVSKSAMTLDGRIATFNGDSRWISNDYSRYAVHRLRGKVDAVLVGAGTFLNDSPRLDIRLDDFSEDVGQFFESSDLSSFGRKNYYMDNLLGKEYDYSNSPLRVVVGLLPEFFENQFDYFFQGDYIIFTTGKELERVRDMGGEYAKRIDEMNIVVAGDRGESVSIDLLLKLLTQRGVMTILLEGGGKLNGAFFDGNYIDQFLYFITPKILGGGKSVVEGEGRDSIARASELKDLSFYDLAGDFLYCGYGESSSEVL